MEKKLEVKELQISFRTQQGILKAVRNISFDLYKGETLAIVGESGSGKSVTSKAIIGILAGNSIVEGGEILYDGQDLLKISEDDFHKLRGDKISMIFQDPLSSLNPIVRIGKQLTEAMVLKGKSSQRNAKREFNYKLKLLKKSLDEVSGADDKEQLALNNTVCKEFDAFCIKCCELEQSYNEARSALVDLDVDLGDSIFLIEKSQKLDLKRLSKKLRSNLKKSIHNYLVSNDNEYEKIDSTLQTLSTLLTQNEKLEALNSIKDFVSKKLELEAPNFFTLGFYLFKNPTLEPDTADMKISELNNMTREYLDNEFMLKFIDLAEEGIQKSYDNSIKLKKEALVCAKHNLEFFSAPEPDKKDSYMNIKQLSKMVENAINRLDTVKKSVEYCFRNAINTAVDEYFFGLKNNPKEQLFYDKQMEKYNKLISAGKQPTWKVTPPKLVDLELAKSNICKVVNNLIKSYENDIVCEVEFDKHQKMVDYIDNMKELATKVCYKVTKKMAKAKALKLMEEVGIPDPHMRYHQYPFEFSGGMRQRIVIAIALSANPDILICDEPTTALDVTIQSQILELINKIKKERQLSVIFITHDLGVVANMADRIAVMYAGKIVEYGTSEDIFYDPRHPYTWALLSSMPDLDTKEKLEAIPGTPPNMIYPPKGDAFAERNKYAMEIDFEEEPPLFEISETHSAATWLLHPNAPKAEPPKIVTERIARMKKEVGSNE